MLHQCLTSWLLTLLIALIVPSIGGDAVRAQGKSDPGDVSLPDGAVARLGTLRWRHAQAVSYVAFAAENTLLTAANDGVLRLWDRETGLEIRRFQMNSSPAPKVVGRQANLGNMITGRQPAKAALSEDGKILATVLANNEIQLWNVRSGAELRKIAAPPSGVAALAFSPDGRTLAVRSGDRSITLVKTGTGDSISRIAAQPINFGNGAVFVANGTTGEASGMVFSRDGKVLATSEIELKLQRYVSYVLLSDVKTGKEIRRVETPDGTSAIAYSSDDKYFAFASARVIHLCNDDGTEIRQMSSPAATGALLFSRDGKTLVAKGRDQVVRLFDTETGQKIRDLGEVAGGPPNVLALFAGITTNETRDLAIAPDGKTLAVAAGPTVRFWDLTSGKELPINPGHRGAVSSVGLAADGKTVLTHAADRILRRWDAATGQELGQWAEPRGTITLAFAPDGRSVAFANADGTIRVHDSADGKERHRFKGHQNGAVALAFSADSAILASRGAQDRLVRLYDLGKGVEMGQMTFQNPKQPGGAVNNFSGPALGGQGLAFSRDGKLLAANAVFQQVVPNPNQPASVNIATTVHLWNVPLRTEIRQIALPPGRAANSLAFSPDGRLLACENSDQTISLCEIASGKERALLGQPFMLAPPAMAPGMIVVNGRGPIRANVNPSGLTFSPDGAFVVARGAENSVRVWDVDRAKELGIFKGHGGPVQAIAMAADGKSLVSGSSDTTAFIWNLASVQREPKAPAAALQADAIESLWADLVGADAAKAGQGILTLASAPKESVLFLSERLRPAAPADAKKLAGWIADLDSNSFQTRSKALAELEKLGDLALPALHKAIDSNLPLETRRRIEPLIEKLTTGDLNAEQIRIIRAMQVLERIGDPQARTLLESLAHGAPGALPTREAQAALANLARTPAQASP